MKLALAIALAAAPAGASGARDPGAPADAAAARVTWFRALAMAQTLHSMVGAAIARVDFSAPKASARPARLERGPRDPVRTLEVGIAQIPVLRGSPGASAGLDEGHGYFQHVRRILERSWSEGLRERLGRGVRGGLRPARGGAAHAVVTLNRAGVVVRARIVEPSGRREFGAAAVRLLNDAGPFPVPSAGLLGADGRVEVRWDLPARPQ